MLSLGNMILPLTHFNTLLRGSTVFIFRADIAVIGLAVMGQNLILNMNDHGYVVCAYNRTPDKVTKFLENEAKNTNVSFQIDEGCRNKLI